MKQHRPEKVMERGEYLTRARELAPRGCALPQSKLIEGDVLAIRSAAVQRQNLRNHIAQNLSNEALAQKFGVHVRTIEKVVQQETWGHV